MHRRTFLKVAGVGALPLLCPEVFLWSNEERATKPATESTGPRWERSLLLIELQGGNDGLNTVVPYKDDEYRKLRPGLALPKESLVPLSETLALHGALKPLSEAWQAQELAIALGVGYDDPNRSHFRSIEIWETASKSDEYLQDGWLARLFSEVPQRADAAVDGIIIGRGSAGPLLGSTLRSVMLEDPERFTRQARAIAETPARSANPALAHLLEVRKELRQAASAIEEKCRAKIALGVEFPAHPLGRQLETAARLLASDLPVAVLKVTHTGFDTHANQPGQQERLLGELAGALAAFRSAILKAKRWDRTLVMTYSEFGRRVAENGNHGTDHGTAAPHFLLGGNVRGGFQGKQPSLTDLLPGGDLKHTLDFRNLYATVASDWWQFPAARAGSMAAWPALPVIRG